MPAEESKKSKQLGFLTVLGDRKKGWVGGFLILNASGRPLEFHCTAPVHPNRAQEILYGNTLEPFLLGEQIAQSLIKRTKTDLCAVLTDHPCVLAAQEGLDIPVIMVFRPETEVSVRDSGSACFGAGVRGAEKSAMGHAFGDDTAISGNAILSETPERENDSENSAGPCEKTAHGESVAVRSDEQEDLTVDYQVISSLKAIPFIPGLDTSLWVEMTENKNHFAVPRSVGENRLDTELLKKQLQPFFMSIYCLEPFDRIRIAIEEARKSA
ncbi:MAG: hypothetical protein IKW74_03845 [Thermoguttaceae bacterium]|nr:hypothetical protein [Thermoguttaceae bacterium]